MTKTREQGDNEYVAAARREAARTGRTVCDILEAWLREAKADRDSDAVGKIVQAQKFAGCRNRRKRGSQ